MNQMPIRGAVKKAISEACCKAPPCAGHVHKLFPCLSLHRSKTSNSRYGMAHTSTFAVLQYQGRLRGVLREPENQKLTRNQKNTTKKTQPEKHNQKNPTKRTKSPLVFLVMLQHHGCQYTASTWLSPLLYTCVVVITTQGWQEQDTPAAAPAWLVFFWPCGSTPTSVVV